MGRFLHAFAGVRVAGSDAPALRQARGVGRPVLSVDVAEPGKRRQTRALRAVRGS